MDDELRTHLEEMEARIMGRMATMEQMNTNHEQVLEKFRAVDITLASHTELMRSNNTLLQMVVATITDYGKRITDLEKKP